MEDLKKGAGDEGTYFLCENETHAHHYSRVGCVGKNDGAKDSLSLCTPNGNVGLDNNNREFCGSGYNSGGLVAPCSGNPNMTNENSCKYGSEIVKSDSMFCAYIEGKRDETIL